MIAGSVEASVDVGAGVLLAAGGGSGVELGSGVTVGGLGVGGGVGTSASEQAAMTHNVTIENTHSTTCSRESGFIIRSYARWAQQAILPRRPLLSLLVHPWNHRVLAAGKDGDGPRRYCTPDQAWEQIGTRDSASREAKIIVSAYPLAFRMALRHFRQVTASGFSVAIPSDSAR